MLLVIESRTDLVAIPIDSTPRSTERALAHMAWPFPVDSTVVAPRRGWSTPVAPPSPSLPPHVAKAEPRRAPHRAEPAVAVPRYGRELAEVH